MTFLAILGKRFGDAGLRDILFETGIVSSGSVDGVLNGKHCNRAIRAHKTVAEALFCVHWLQFEEHIKNTQLDLLVFKELMNEVRTQLSPTSIASVLSNDKFKAIKSCYRQFCSISVSPTASLWMSYIDMVFLLLRFVRATREAQWDLHLQCIHEILPWTYAYDCVNYARYLSVYYYEMSCLPVTHPDAYNRMQRGEFAVQRSDRSFSQVAVDHAIEQSINRDMKTSGGVIGISQQTGAVHRWILNAHHRSAFTRQCRQLAACSSKETDDARDANLASQQLSAESRKDENDVKTVNAFLDCLGVNLFADNSDDFVGFCSGVTAPCEVKDDLLLTCSKGEAKMTQFFQQRLLSDDVDFLAS